MKRLIIATWMYSYHINNRTVGLFKLLSFKVSEHVFVVRNLFIVAFYYDFYNSTINVGF